MRKLERTRKESLNLLVIKLVPRRKLIQEVLKCKSCGSFRHLLNDCPDSWENMRKKADKENTEKSQSQSDPRKIV